MAEFIPWWKERREKVGAALTEVAKEIRDEQRDRRKRLSQFVRYYLNINPRGMVQAPAASMKPPASKKNQGRLTFNLGQAAIDTVNAKIAKNNPKPSFLTFGGDYGDQKRAKYLDQLVQGCFYEGGVKKKAPIAQRDSGILGTGALVVQENPITRRVDYIRALIDELYVDDTEAIYGPPRTLYWRRVRPKDELIGEYATPRKGASKRARENAEKLRKIIEKAPLVDVALTGLQERGVRRAQLVEVVESWHLPSCFVPEMDEDLTPDDDDYYEASIEGHDGRHSIALPSAPGGDGTVIFEAWRRNSFPVAFLHWTDPVLGMWGQGAMDQLEGIIIEVENTLRVLSKSARFSIPKLYVDKGAKVSLGDLDDRPGIAVEGNFFAENGGRWPQMVQWEGISLPLLDYLDRQVRQGFEIVGVSLMSASGRKPSGLESGAALREYHDIETERFALLARAYEEFHVELARQTIDCVREISAREEDGYEVTATRTLGKSTFQVNWRDIELPPNAFVMQVFPTSALPTTPAGRLAMVQDLGNMGFLDREAMLRLLDFPDLEAENRLALASAEFQQKQIEDMIERGLPRKPQPYQNIPNALKHAEAAYLRAVDQDVPETKLELVRAFIAACTDLLKKTAPPPMPALGPGPVPPGAPAGAMPPPGPPGMAPPAGPPIPPPVVG